MRRVLLVGATGFVGGHVLEALNEKGWCKTTCFVRKHSVNKLPSEQHCTNLVETAMAFDTAIYCAGVLGKRGIPSEKYFDAHVRLPVKIIEQLGTGSRFVYVSTAYVLYPSKEPGYIRSKVVGEEAVTMAAKRRGVNLSIVRPGFIIGPGDMHHYPLYKWINRLGPLFPIMGDGRNIVTPTYVGDVVSAVISAAEGKLESPVHVAGDQQTMNNFLAVIAYMVGRSKPKIHLPPIFKADFFTGSKPFPRSAGVPVTSLADAVWSASAWYHKEGLL